MATKNTDVKKDQTMMVQEEEFGGLCRIIEYHRTRALAAVNGEHLQMCWQVGAYLSVRLESGSWGDGTVRALADYIKRNHPSMKGYGKSNLYNMVKFYREYSSEDFLGLLKRYSDHVAPVGQLVSSAIVQPAAGQSVEEAIVQPVAGQIPDVLQMITYTHHTIILNRCQNPQERLFYILYASHERLGKRELEHCISSQTYENLLGGDKKNFSEVMLQRYPSAGVMFKDTLMLDFLALPPKATEPRIHKAINGHMKEFLLEMGKEDMIFVQDEYPVKVGGKTFHLDFLFYHRILHCYVGVELKAGEFSPRDQGQLEFYLSYLDKDIKRPEENPSIGILLCREANRAVVEYALSKSLSPTMVAEYKRILIPKEVLQKSLDEFVDFSFKS